MGKRDKFAEAMAQDKAKKFKKGKLVAKRQGMFGVITDFGDAAKRMKGAEIISVGFHEACDEGGFAIDFQHEGKGVERLVLGYTELGEWVDFLGKTEV